MLSQSIGKNIRLPYLLFVYITIVIMAFLCILMLYSEKNAIKQELLAIEQKLLYERQEKIKLENELQKLNRYAEQYGTSPEIIGAVFYESENNGIDPAIMLELIKTESDYDSQAVSSEGAEGLCQLIPNTAKALCRELEIDYHNELLNEPLSNIKLGAYYLAKLLKMHDFDYHMALTAYNRGPEGLKRYIERTGTAVSTFSSKISENSGNI